MRRQPSRTCGGRSVVDVQSEVSDFPPPSRKRKSAFIVCKHIDTTCSRALTPEERNLLQNSSTTRGFSRATRALLERCELAQLRFTSLSIQRTNKRKKITLNLDVSSACAIDLKKTSKKRDGCHGVSAQPDREGSEQQQSCSDFSAHQKWACKQETATAGVICFYNVSFRAEESDSCSASAQIA